MSDPQKAPKLQDLAPVLESLGEDLLHRRAWDYYNGDSLDLSIEPFRQAVELAARRGDVGVETDQRFWLGTALHGCGRLLEAVEAMAPTLDEAKFVGGRTLQNRLLTRYVLVCVDIPLPLDYLEPAFAQVEQLIRSWGWQDKESRLAFARGRLALYRGHADQALHWSQLAMGRRRIDPSNYAPHTYLHLFLRACVLAGRVDLLKEVMDSGETFEHHNFRSTRLIVLRSVQAEVARLEGDLDQALEHSRVAEQAGWLNQDLIYRQIAFVTRLRTVLAAGQTEMAKPILRDLLRRRHGENLHDGFESRLLLGDYHLAEARRLRCVGTAAEVTRHREAAARIYAGARRVGLVVDARLKCHGKRNLVNGRLKEVQDF